MYTKNEKYTAIPTGNTYVLPISTNALKYISKYTEDLFLTDKLALLVTARKLFFSKKVFFTAIPLA